MADIRTFLTQASAPVYNRVTEIVAFLETVFGAKIVIYGGFVRSLLDHFYHPSNEFTFKDVDLWVKFQRKCSMGQSSWNGLFKRSLTKIQERYTVGAHRMCVSPYPANNVIIDGMSFDLSTEVNWHGFQDLADFTVNNLYIEDFQVKIRHPCEYDLMTTLQHIHEKRLVYLITPEHQNYDPLTVEARLNKMMERGYDYREDEERSSKRARN